MDYYIVRIYRHEKKKLHNLVGIVEEVDPKRDRKIKKAFTSFDELWEILNATGQLPKRSSLSSPSGERAKGKQKRRC